MAYDIIQSVSATNSVNGTSVGASLTPTPGNIIVIVGGWQSPNTGVINFPAGFTTDESITDGGGPGVLAVASRIVPASPPTSYTITGTLSNDKGICIIELPPGASDANASVRNVGTSLSIPSITPTAGLDAILLALVWYGAGYGISPTPSGYTGVIDLFLSSASTRFWIGKKLVNPTTGSYSSTYGASGNSVANFGLHAAYGKVPTVGRSQGIII